MPSVAILILTVAARRKKKKCLTIKKKIENQHTNKHTCKAAQGQNFAKEHTLFLAQRINFEILHKTEI